MWEKIKTWWKNPKTKIGRAEIELEQRLQSLEKHIDEAYEARNAWLQRAEEAEKELAVFRTMEAEDEARRSGKEPWVEIRSADTNDARGLRIELDWNTAFVEYLKENGIKGKIEEEVVQKWLAMLYQDLIEKLESKIIDEKDKPQINDFE